MNPLFSLDLLDEDIANFDARGKKVIIEGSKLRGKVAIVPTGTKPILGCVCYYPDEVLYMLNLDEVEAIKLHEMKRIFGGSVKTTK